MPIIKKQFYMNPSNLGQYLKKENSTYSNVIITILYKNFINHSNARV